MVKTSEFSKMCQIFANRVTNSIIDATFHTEFNTTYIQIVYSTYRTGDRSKYE